MNRIVYAFVPLLFLGACATTPLPINQGAFSAVAPPAALAKEAAGKRVRWGGTIISVAPSQKETCFEILSRPLYGDGEPKAVDATDGRFVACSPQFYDPAAYPAGRSMTVAGTVQAPVACKIGSFEGTCPRVEIEVLHLWPKREYSPMPCYYDPFWGPYWHPYPRYYP
jgi:outer membrane lipoprotein